MTMSFREICDQIGYNPNAAAPERKVIYFAYKEGECRKFDTREEAVKFSKLYEKMCVTQSDINEFRRKQCELKKKAVEVFCEQHFEEYRGSMTRRQFNLLWDKANQDADEDVSLAFHDLVDVVFRFNALRQEA